MFAAIICPGVSSESFHSSAETHKQGIVIRTVVATGALQWNFIKMLSSPHGGTLREQHKSSAKQRSVSFHLINFIIALFKRAQFDSS